MLDTYVHALRARYRKDGIGASILIIDDRSSDNSFEVYSEGSKR